MCIVFVKLKYAQYGFMISTMEHSVKWYAYQVPGFVHSPDKSTIRRQIEHFSNFADSSVCLVCITHTVSVCVHSVHTTQCVSVVLVCTVCARFAQCVHSVCSTPPPLPPLPPLSPSVPAHRHMAAAPLSTIVSLFSAAHQTTCSASSVLHQLVHCCQHPSSFTLAGVHLPKYPPCSIQLKPIPAPETPPRVQSRGIRQLWWTGLSSSAK